MTEDIMKFRYTDGKPHLRRFHQARWDEPIIFELSQQGQRGVLLPEAESEIKEIVGDVLSTIPETMRRKQLPELPEMSQAQVLRHYLRLSQENLGADLNVDIGQGTCTMKYNPKVNEQLARLPGIAEIHPLQDEDTVQGILEIMYQFEQILKEISGMDRFSFQSSHPSNAACAKVAGYKIITLYPDEDGYPDLYALKEAVSERTAGLMITNPEDTGIFNPKITEFVKVVHAVGGLCFYDQANANGILGMTRARDAGFDMCHFNLHKTFAAPHGCGGPGGGAAGVSEELAKFLPVPLVRWDGKKYFLDHNRPDSIGKIRSFYGVAPVILKAYAWVMSLGADGLREVAEIAVLNNNYLLKKMLEIPGVSAPYAAGKPRKEQVRYSWKALYDETGVSSEDIGLRAADFGLHYWTSHHPFVVPEPNTLEPTESYTKAEIDEYVMVLRQIADEARTDPDLVKTAPHNSTVHRIVNHDPLDKPEQWAVTWRAYRRKLEQN